LERTINRTWHTIALVGAAIGWGTLCLIGLAVIWQNYRTTKDRRWLLAAIILGIPGTIVVAIIFASNWR
jgi:multisubunit Na+/H+ antiporter MnhB subunit